MFESSDDEFWSSSAAQAAKLVGTPCYIFSWPHVQLALEELTQIRAQVPIRHWLSLKTQPLIRLAEEWLKTGRGIEVVSSFELQAAIRAGYPNQLIVVNGPAKHSWMKKLWLEGLTVNFDSLEEARALSDTAKALNWRVGLRFAMGKQYDPDEPEFGTQFGLDMVEMQQVVRILRAAGIAPEVAHFHLRSNVPAGSDYREAAREIAMMCAEIQFTPRVLDCGGGLPCLGEHVDTEPIWSDGIPGLNTVLSEIGGVFPELKEIWFENGRFVTSRAGVLVLSVLDVKERPECRYLICDGGRTNHAIVSDWERHRIISFPKREGKTRLTTVCGPSCMAYDRLCRLDLPNDIRRGDLIIWHNAGAYHLPWETRFSHGVAPIVWIDRNGSMSVARERETFSQWYDCH